MPELLAPAGDIEKMRFAYHYGADAIYCGGQNFSLRANAKNFSLDQLKEASIFAHSLNKKIYVTVNIVFHDEDLNGLEDYLKYLDSINIDGIIASDITVIKLCKELNLKLKVCLSTQASVLNKKAALFWKNLGVSRIVLAREASKEDILSISKTNIEIETFIHGAMCTSFSGKCVLSNYITNRDSNRGGCAQICRWEFNTSNKDNLTIMPKDLNMVPFIKEQIDMGVSSFKIEGRMRSIYYVSTVLYCYRKMIDAALDGTLTKDMENYYLKVLNRCANRESMPQFFEGIPHEDAQYYNGRNEVSNQDFLGLVLDYDENKKMATIEVRNYFEKGYEVEIFGPNHETFTLIINKIYDDEENIISICNHPKSIVKIPVLNTLSKNDIMRLKVIDK